MNAWLIAARALHDVSLVSLAGSLAFLALIAEPAFRAARAGAAEAAVLRRRLVRLAWASLVIALLSGALWLLLEARSMSGEPLAAVLNQGIVGTVLAETQFGHDWVVRLALALVLAPALLGVQRGAAMRLALPLALLCSAALLGGVAWAGHAGATPGAEGDLHLVSDVLHLLAAGAWLGSLVPLALLFAQALRQPSLTDVARSATRRFSVLGLASVALLLLTGIVNSLILVGTIPALLGTLYGQLLLLKIACFAAMVAVASVNRQRLTPQLIAEAAPLAALQRLRRNASIEAALGLAVLCIVGALGTLPPGAHSEPVWPLPFRLDLAALRLDAGTALAGVMVALGIVALALAALRRRGGWANAVIGVALVVGFGWRPIAATWVRAFPTSFYQSPVAFAAPSIMRGAKIYAENCMLCHGAGGRGDGPAAASLPKQPSDLTAAHIFSHRPGDLFWWIGHGRGVMPAFADIVGESERWDVINFILARAAAVQPRALLPEVTPGPAPQAPDFAFEQNGRQGTLRQAIARTPVLLVFYRLPDARPRLRQLAAAQDRLAAAGLSLLALPIEGSAPDAEAGALPAFAATSDADAAEAYALFEGGAPTADCEFLVDRAGYLRARWTGAAAPPETATLLAQLGRLAAMPLQQQAAHHHH